MRRQLAVTSTARAPAGALFLALRGARPRTIASRTTARKAAPTSSSLPRPAKNASHTHVTLSTPAQPLAPREHAQSTARLLPDPALTRTHQTHQTHQAHQTHSTHSTHVTHNEDTTRHGAGPQPLHAFLHGPGALPFIPATSSHTPALPSQTSAYDTLLQQSFMNPFTGKIAAMDSTAFRQLERLGFSMDVEKPLCLRWRLSDLEAACLDVRHQHGRAGSLAKLPKLSKPTTPDAAGAAADKGHHAPNTAELAVLLKPFQAAKARPHTKATTTTATVLAERPSKNWRAEVVAWFSRTDMALAIPTLLQSRYAELLSAYMPPKLDAVPDPAVIGVHLTRDQQHALTLAQRGYHLFIGGSAGTGKTVLLKAIFRELAQHGLRVAMTATTGVAAVQLGGCTFHSAFDVPVVSGETSVMRRPQWDANALRAVDVVIVDEVSLLNSHVLDAFDAEARLARLSTAPFGGIQVILCGDFLQLSHDAVVEALPVYLSAAFQHLVALQLVTPMRHREGDPLLALLHGLRKGVFDPAVFATLDRPLPPTAESVTYLFPRRREAQALNDTKLCELHTEELVCTPQRGPLQLVGRFTASALMELPASMHSVPSRATLVGMLHESLHTKHGARSRLGHVCVTLPELDVVVMPSALNQGQPPLSFFLRVRLGGGRAPPRRGVSAASSSTPVTEPHAADVVAVLPESNAQGALGTQSTPGADTERPSPPPVRASTLFEQDPALWRTVCEDVASRLGGRLVTLYEREPISLVPLSVTRALADATRSTDAAEALSPLRLKLGCRVMVNRNLSRSVSNGSVGVVEAYVAPDLALFPRHSDRSNHFLYKRLLEQKPFPLLPIVRLLSGELVQIPPQSRLLGGTAATHYYGHDVFSVPLQLGYGFTVHKVQGLTLSGTVVLDCERFFECPHLLYVACSRVRSVDQLIVRHVEQKMVIVKRSALEFSDGLREARDAQVLSPPPHLPRAAWTDVLKPRVFSISE